MVIRDRVKTRGSIQSTRIVGLAVLCFVFMASAALAEQPSPSPSPLYQQSLQKSIEKFHNRDRGGGTPRVVNADRFGEEVVGLEAVSDRDTRSPIIAESFAKPAGTICHLQRDANSPWSIFTSFVAGDKIAVYYNPNDPGYGCGVADPYPC